MTAPLPSITESLAQQLLAQNGDGGSNVVDPTQPAQQPAGQGDGTTNSGDGTTTSQGQNPTTNTPPPGGGGGLFGGGSFLPIMILIFVVMWVFLLGGNRKEKKRRKALLEALHKGQRVQTVGGIIGSVVEVRDNEVVVKVDENANTRLRFTKAAIQSVLEDGAKPELAEK